MKILNLLTQSKRIEEKYPHVIGGAILLLMALILAKIVMNYPGVFSPDSNFQFAQALGEKFFDWHPPFIAYFWNKLFIFSGPIPKNGLLFLYQNMAFGVGLSAIIYSVWKRSSGLALIATIGFLLITPLNIITLHNWKDCLVMANLVLFCGLLLVFKNSTNSFLKAITLIILLALLLKTSLERPASSLALIPLCYWAFRSFFPKMRKVTLFCIVVLSGIVFLSSNFIFMRLIPVKKEYIIQYTLLSDIIKIRAHNDIKRIEEPFLIENFGEIDLTKYKNYHPSINRIFSPNGPSTQGRLNEVPGAFRAFKTSAPVKKLSAIWRHEVLNNFPRYILIKSVYVIRFLWLMAKKNIFAFLFFPCSLVILVRNRKVTFSNVLTVSSLLYLLPYLMLLQAFDVRYFYWAYLSGYLALIFHIKTLISRPVEK